MSGRAARAPGWIAMAPFDVLALPPCILQVQADVYLGCCLTVPSAPPVWRVDRATVVRPAVASPLAAGSAFPASASGRRSRTAAPSASSALRSCDASGCRRRARWWGWTPPESCRGRMLTALPWRSATRCAAVEHASAVERQAAVETSAWQRVSQQQQQLQQRERRRMCRSAAHASPLRSKPVIAGSLCRLDLVPSRSACRAASGV